MEDKITGLNSLASLHAHSSRQMFFCEDLLSYYKPCLHDDYNRDAGKAREIWSKDILQSLKGQKGVTHSQDNYSSLDSQCELLVLTLH